MQVAEENPSGEPAAFGCLKPLRYCLIWIALYELTLGLAAEIVSDYLLEPQSRDGYAALMALGGFAFLSSSLSLETMAALLALAPTIAVGTALAPAVFA
jgi:hypothetical protein